MIHRIADGATVHALNNKLAAMTGACSFGQRDTYYKALREFLDIAKSSSYMRK